MEYVSTVLILIACAFSYIKIATRYNIVDNPNFRSSHTVPVIRGGGILFYVSVLLFALWNQWQYPFFLVAISLVSLISFLDDMYTLSAKVRLPFHFISIGLVLYEVGLFEGPWYIVIIAAIVGVGLINLYNFMDGINGITGIYSITVVLSFLYLFYERNMMHMSLLISLLISLIIFGYFNFRKRARMFAGDIGSMAMAISIFFLGIYALVKLEAPILLLMVAVYCADSMLTISYRLYIGESITQPHRHHIYQKLVDVAKWSHIKVSIYYAVYQLIINSVVIQTYKLSLNSQIWIILGVGCVLMLHYFVLFRKLKPIN